jgi:hypothetical protein
VIAFSKAVLPQIDRHGRIGDIPVEMNTDIDFDEIAGGKPAVVTRARRVVGRRLVEGDVDRKGDGRAPVDDLLLHRVHDVGDEHPFLHHPPCMAERLLCNAPRLPV